MAVSEHSRGIPRLPFSCGVENPAFIAEKTPKRTSQVGSSYPAGPHGGRTTIYAPRLPSS